MMEKVVTCHQSHSHGMMIERPGVKMSLWRAVDRFTDHRVRLDCPFFLVLRVIVRRVYLLNC